MIFFEAYLSTLVNDFIGPLMAVVKLKATCLGASGDWMAAAMAATCTYVMAVPVWTASASSYRCCSMVERLGALFDMFYLLVGLECNACRMLDAVLLGIDDGYGKSLILLVIW